MQVCAAATLCILTLGCSADRLPRETPIPRANDLFVANATPLNVTWLGRHEVMMTRHQWDALDHEGDRHRVAARRRDRPIMLSLLAGGEGSGFAYDWVVLRVAPPVGTHNVSIDLYPLTPPAAGDCVLVLAYPFSRDSGQESLRVLRQRLVHGVIEEVVQAAHHSSEATERRPSGTLYWIRLVHPLAGRGWSGGSVIVWDRTGERWRVLGVVGGGSDDISKGDMSGAETRHVLVVRPPTWVFDLLTPDVPGVTLPEEAP